MPVGFLPLVFLANFLDCYNLGRELFGGGSQETWENIGTALDISGFALTAGSTGWGKALEMGVNSVSGVARSMVTQFGKMVASAFVGSKVGSYVENAVTKRAGENWGRAAGLAARFGSGIAAYGVLDLLDQKFNVGGLYKFEGINTFEEIRQANSIDSNGLEQSQSLVGTPKSADYTANSTLRHTPEQQLVIATAKAAVEEGRIPLDEALSLIEDAHNANISARLDLGHPTGKNPTSTGPHLHIGKIGHIPIGPRE